MYLVLFCIVSGVCIASCLRNGRGKWVCIARWNYVTSCDPGGALSRLVAEELVLAPPQRSHSWWRARGALHRSALEEAFISFAREEPLLAPPQRRSSSRCRGGARCCPMAEEPYILPPSQSCSLCRPGLLAALRCAAPEALAVVWDVVWHWVWYCVVCIVLR